MDLVKIKLFINTLDNLLEFLDDMFPEFKSDISVTKQAISLAKLSNPKVVVEQFMESIIPYTKHISECNEEFFLNFENLETLHPSNVVFAKRLKDIWLSEVLTIKDKARIWLYFQKLSKYGDNVLDK